MKNYLAIITCGLLISCTTVQPEVIPTPPSLPPVVHATPPNPISKAKIVAKKKQIELDKAIHTCSNYKWHLEGCMEIDSLLSQKKNSDVAKALAQKKHDADENKVKDAVTILKE